MDKTDRYISVADIGKVCHLHEEGDIEIFEVVRCGNCKHYNEHPSGFGCCEIHKGSIAIQTPFTFCAWGETKDEQTI